MPTTSDLVRTTRLAYRLPPPIPNRRLAHAHKRPGEVPPADISDNESATPAMAADGVELGVPGAVRRSQLRPFIATRRTHDETLLVLRRFLVLALVAVGMVVPMATAGAIALRTAAHAVTVDSQSGAKASWAAAAARQEASPPEAADLQVHVQTQASLPAGSERQFRLAVDGGNGIDASGDGDVVPQSLLVELAINPEQSTGSSATVTPTRIIVNRSELKLTPIWIKAAADAPCGSDLGELHVHIRELTTAGSQGTTTVTLPPVDCTPAPPSIPKQE